MNRSWDHAVAPLDPEVVDEHDRWGRRCAIHRCAEPVTHQTSYRCVTGQGGRVSLAERRVCDGHAARFAQRYQVEIGPAPARTESRPVDGGVPAVYQAELRRVRMEPAGGWWLSLARAGGGGLASWRVPKLMAAGGTGLDEAVHAADVFLARSRMLVAQVWQRAGDRATATLMPVTDTPAWRGISWVCTVACGPDALGKPTWYLELQLASEFAPLRGPLGNTGMDLNRAVGTGQRYLERTGWTLAGEWTSSGQVAVVHAHPPARPAAIRPVTAPAGAGWDAHLRAVVPPHSPRSGETDADTRPTGVPRAVGTGAAGGTGPGRPRVRAQRRGDHPARGADWCTAVLGRSFAGPTGGG